MRNRLVVVVGFVLAVAAAPRTSRAAQVTTDLPSGQSVGTTITVGTDTPASSDTRFRFAVMLAGEPVRIIYDFQPENSFLWTPITEGTYVIAVDVSVSGSVTTLTASFTVTARSPLAWVTPVVTPTAHPLVAMFSAPPCAPAAAFMRVFFASTDSPVTQHATDMKPCTADRTMNFYIGGMRANHIYFMRHELLDPFGQHLAFGDLRAFQTGTAAIALPMSVVGVAPGLAPSLESIVLQSPLVGDPSRGVLPFPYAVDTEGQVVWYADRPDTLTRPAGDGLFTMLTSDSGKIRTGVRLFNLAGNTVRVTNVEQINVQLVTMGRDPINDVHHEARLLPDGNLAVLGSIEKTVTDVQGAGSVDVMGDAVVVLDPNFQVVWTWSEFDHLSLARAAILGETCSGQTQAGCSPVNQAATANDWTHSNGIAYDPADGNLVVSIRHQDWLVKIDYRNGAGTGAIVWRLGAGGDFFLDSPDPTAWFSHQHDPNFAPGHRIVLYDNGNTRCAAAPDPTQCHSRGQVYELDEVNHIAHLAVNVDLGEYSFALGSAQALANGDFYFASGALTTPGGNVSHTTEARADAIGVYGLASDTWVYRSHRLLNLYLTPADWATPTTLNFSEFFTGVP